MQALNPLETVGRQLVLHPSVGSSEAAEMLGGLNFTDPQRILASYPGQLSGGERQRVCLALALLAKPALVLADEITSALDTISQADVMACLRAHTGRSASAVLFITHDLALAASLCDRALVMSAGAIVADGPVVDLITNPDHPWIEEVVRASRSAGVLSGAR